MAYTTNRFCWHGLNSDDPQAAAAFYVEVLPWKLLSEKMGGGDATMFVANGVPVGHYMEKPMPGVPDHWDNYLRVDDVDATAEAAQENGGKVVVPGTDIPVGRFALLASPSGGHISIFHENDEEGAVHHPGGLGSVAWCELHSTDIDTDLAWLKSTFGFETKDMPMPQGGTYHLLVSGGEQRAGACTAFFPEAPSMWLTWFAVDNTDDAVARVEQHGGKIFSPPVDYPGVGRMAVASDPGGAVFGILQPEGDDA